MEKGGAEAAAAVTVTPDASVLLRWVLPGDDERDTDEAVAGTLELVVPQLWTYEVGNKLARSLRRRSAAEVTGTRERHWGTERLGGGGMGDPSR